MDAQYAMQTFNPINLYLQESSSSSTPLHCTLLAHVRSAFDTGIAAIKSVNG